MPNAPLGAFWLLKGDIEMTKLTVFLLLFTGFAACAEENKPAPLVSTVIQERIGALVSAAASLVERFDAAAKEGNKEEKTAVASWASRWKEISEQQDSLNASVNTLLIERLCEIRKKQNDNKEPSKESVYQTCQLLVKYKDGEMAFPSCVAGMIADTKTFQEAVCFLDSAYRPEKLPIQEEVSEKKR